MRPAAAMVGRRRRGWSGAMSCAALLLWTLAATAAAPAPVAAAPPAAVATDAGDVQGTLDDGVTAFLGIPYAAPPTGSLRWRAPQPAPPWTGARDATRPAPDCLQGMGDVRPESEDCLYLNVWTPGAQASATRPVMVWIHGGAYIMGSGAEPVFRGTNLAKRGVVVVTLNYRLGRFGFFAHPALTHEHADGLLGNYALLDQMAALRWVRRNAAAFGGDPRNVTVFGESAGAFSVNALLASPLAEGLFDKAISQSGGGQKRFRLPDVATQDVRLADAEARGLAWGRAVHVADDDAAALRAVPASAVLAVLPPLRGEAPIIDGTVLPRPVDVAFLKGMQAKVPFLVGANSQEETLARWLPGVVDETIAALGRHRDDALALYTRGGAVDGATAAGALWGEQAMVGPARFLARRMAATGAPTWLYRYSYVAKAMRGKARGAGHGAEVGLVFENEVVANEAGTSAADAAMARTLAGHWVRFASTGDPNVPGATAWPRYRAAEDALLDFTDDGAVVRTHFGRERLDLLDRVYLERNALVEH